MLSLDDRFLLMRASICANKDDTDEKMKKFDSKLYNIIALFDHMLHHNQIYSSYKYVKDDELPEITKSTTETKPSKSDL